MIPVVVIRFFIARAFPHSASLHGAGLYTAPLCSEILGAKKGASGFQVLVFEKTNTCRSNP
ncbi:MAG: hypothetical protein JXR70_08725 [Spirochaetales bacterium]|nr:hypothetical protein [Spirochaetales bacterium]